MPKPTLRLNASGLEVKELQTLLIGYADYIKCPPIGNLKIDGEFGEKTRACVLSFQKQVFLPETGVVADLTWGALSKRAPFGLPDVKFGESNEYVKLLENRLVVLGYLKGQADNKYEQRTVEALAH